MNLWNRQLTQYDNWKIWRIFAIASKKRPIKKVKALSHLKKKIYMKYWYFFWLDLVLEARAEILKKIIGFLEDLKAPKGHFEINWPLVFAHETLHWIIYTLKRSSKTWSLNIECLNEKINSFDHVEKWHWKLD